MPYLRVSLKCLKPNGIPQHPKTLGEHLLARRLTLGLFQKDVGKLVGTDATSVLNWEKGYTAPAIHFYPAIKAFLGYIPESPARTLGARLQQTRRWMGLSIDALAAQLTVDPASIGNWERGELILYHQHRKMVAEFLNEPVADIQSAMAVQWGEKHQLYGRRWKTTSLS